MSKELSSGMQPEDITALRQVVDPRVSPDGKWVAFGVTSVDKEENRYTSRDLDRCRRRVGPSPPVHRWAR